MIYFDYGATSPLRKEVWEAMYPYFHSEYGNPGSLHDLGTNSLAAIENSRAIIAHSLGAESPKEIIFTSSGTEANNLALIGVAKQYQKQGSHLITTQVEHPSILETCRFLEDEGFAVTYLPVNDYGMVSPEQVVEAITPQTILVSVMAANNEVGTLQPIEQIAQMLKDKPVLFHTDAIQYIGKIPFSLHTIPVDLMSIGSHKIYGPKGIGALYLRKGTRLKPLLHGGGHERGLRPSTLATPLIVGFATAISYIEKEVLTEQMRLSQLRDLCWRRIQDEIGDVVLHGDPITRLPGNLNLSFKGIEGQAILLDLSREGICVSSGSACSAGKHQASHVLKAMGKSDEVAYQSIRITLGKDTNEQEIELLVTKLCEIVQYYRTLF